jgi:hypothetical protein
MYGSIFREWKMAACLVLGVAALAAAFFSDGGGYESLQVGQAAPVAASAPVPGRKAAAPTATSGGSVAAGFTPDAELEAEFADPPEPAPSESAAPVAAASTPVAEIPPPLLSAGAATPDSGSAPADQPR